MSIHPFGGIPVVCGHRSIIRNRTGAGREARVDRRRLICDAGDFTGGVLQIRQFNGGQVPTPFASRGQRHSPVGQSSSRPHGPPSGFCPAQQSPLSHPEQRAVRPVQHRAPQSAASAQQARSVTLRERQVGLGQAPPQQRNPDPAAPQGVLSSTGVHPPLLQVWQSGQLAGHAGAQAPGRGP